MPILICSKHQYIRECKIWLADSKCYRPNYEIVFSPFSTSSHLLQSPNPVKLSVPASLPYLLVSLCSQLTTLGHKVN